MYILAIDTSNSDSYVALFKNKKCINKKLLNYQNQSKYILMEIDNILNEEKILLKDIKFIGICVGPGSFTGTRIGVVTAKTLSYSIGIPIIEFNSLIPYSQTNSCTIINSKNEHCFSLKRTLKLTTYKKLKDEKKTITTPTPEIISKYLPNLKIIKTYYDINKIINYIIRKFKKNNYTSHENIEIIYSNFN